MKPMPPVYQHPTPNYTPTLIRHDLVIVHRTEGSYSGAVTWLCDPRSNASAHLVMNLAGTEVSQLVPLQYKAWAQKAFNSAGVSLEIEGFTKDGFSGTVAWDAARIVAWLCREYGIPPAWAKNGQGRGVCQHHDLGVAGGGHVDCCGVGSPEWLSFIGYVKEEFDAFGDGLLPPFALHGLPQTHEIAAPLDHAPEPSHSGEARVEARGQPALHPTASGYPNHSVADWQWRLNKLGEHLAVDGWWGVKTKSAVEDFQRAHGLAPDGVPGPLTWAALQKATA